MKTYFETFLFTLLLSLTTFVDAQKLPLIKDFRGQYDYTYIVLNDEGSYSSISDSLEKVVSSVKRIEAEKVTHIIFYWRNGQKASNSFDDVINKTIAVSDIQSEFKNLPMVFPNLNTVELNLIGLGVKEDNFKDLIKGKIPNVKVSNVDGRSVKKDFPKLVVYW